MTSQPDLARWRHRVAAAMVDAFVLVVVPSALVLALPWVGYLAGVDVGDGWGLDPLFEIFLGFVLVWPLVGGLYSGLLMSRAGARNGQTWGKQLAGIRVVHTSGEAMSFRDAAVRDGPLKWALLLSGALLGAFTFGVPVWIQWLWPLWDKENRALHDMMASTRVVEVPDAVPVGMPPTRHRRSIRLLALGGFVSTTGAFFALAVWSVVGAFGGPIHHTEIVIVEADGSGRAPLTRTLARRAAGPVWSPDGARIAFKAGPYGGGVFVINPDGSDRRRLTENGSDPVWSPDARRLAFTGEGGGLFVINADGTGRTALGGGSHPVWSPDGSRIAFRSGSDLYVTRPDAPEQTLHITDSAFFGDPAWSPDGTRLVFVDLAGTRPELHVTNADGLGRTRLTSSGSEPAWSPDGTRIAFTGSGEDEGIHVIHPDGSGEARLNRGGSHPVWSPDGKRIAFTSRRAGGTGPIFLVDADGSNEVRLTRLRPRLISPLHTQDGGGAWSPDGRFIAFTRSHSG